MTKSSENLIKYGSALLIMGSAYKITGLVNTLTFQSSRSLELAITVDSFIPFVPEGIWAYSLYYVILVSGFILAFDHNIFDKFFKQFIITSAVANFCFILLPVHMPLQELHLFEKSLTTKLFEFILFVDTRSNCFPSLHCAHSFLITYWFSRSSVFSRFLTWALLLMTILVVVSTLITKQHWFIDIIGSFILIIAILRIYEKKLQDQSV